MPRDGKGKPLMTDPTGNVAARELERVTAIADWYHKDQLDFDRRLIRYRYRTLKPHLNGPEGLELGPADGEMTSLLLSDFERLTIVEGAAKLLEGIPDAPNLVKVHSVFEAYEPSIRFDTILMEHILEHVDDPVALLQRAGAWLAPGGKILAGVPNGHSIHRLAAVKMGLLAGPCELNARDHSLGHRRVYTPVTFRADIEAAGLRIVEQGGVYFKPLANKQIEDNWTDPMIEGFYELGKDFPDVAAELYVVCVAHD